MNSGLRSGSRMNYSALPRRATHREPVDAQRGLANADRHALAILAAGADARVEREVVADHRYARERIGPVADERGALHRIGELALLDFPGFRRREHELAVGDVDLAAAEIHRIEPFVDRGDDLGRMAIAIE